MAEWEMQDGWMAEWEMQDGWNGAGKYHTHLCMLLVN